VGESSSGFMANGTRVRQALEDCCGKASVEQFLRYLVGRIEIGAGSSECFVYEVRVVKFFGIFLRRSEWV
jgi:hypothetical protein